MVATNTENRLLLYNTNMTPQNYNEYINQCSNKYSIMMKNSRTKAEAMMKKIIK